jgi:hydroxyacylglutathione hydrolase
VFFRQIVDDQLAQNAYLIGCQRTGEALVVDPERDVDRYLALAEREGLRITAAAETHIHADFLSGCRQLAERGVRIYLSAEGGPDWTYRWPDQGDYDVVLLRDGDTLAVGAVELRAVLTPGHTPEHLSFMVTDRGGGATEAMGMVSGDFVFVGDTGRPDLLETAAGVEGAMEEGARSLFGSVQDFLGLPDYLQVWPGHGAGSACGKALGAVPDTTVGYERRTSPALRAAEEGRETFVEYILDAQPEPPLYFGRMKRLNRDGPPVLAGLPRPAPVPVDEIDRLLGRDDRILVDARENRVGFMAGHLPGSLYVPLDRSFPTVAGSYVEPGVPLILVVEEGRVEGAVRSLVRIGLDRVEGYVTPHVLESWVDRGGHLERIHRIDEAGELERRRRDPGTRILDVRGAAEYAEEHLPDALHVAHTRLLDRLGELPRDRTLLVHCQSGARSAVATALLVRHGFDAVHIDGLVSEWFERYGGESVAGATSPG